MKLKNTLLLTIITLNLITIASININETIATSSNIYIDVKNINGPWTGTLDHPFKSIQDGIDNSLENGTIYVANGTYHENIILDKSLILVGEDKTNTFIDGNGNQNVLQIKIDNITIMGFTITNATNGLYLVNTHNNIISNNTIMNNTVGISTENNSNNSYIYYNNFLKNNIHTSDIFLNFYYKDSTGNYWDDYNGTDENNNGIGDTPYTIHEENKDLYPLIKPITIRPIADFRYTPNNPTTQDTISFNDNSQDTDGYIVNWYWSFGDGSNQTGKNTTHKYEDNGIYNISLKVIDNYGSQTQILKKITVFNENPTADFSINPENPTDIQKISFKDKSNDTDGYITNWSWDFGDGNISTLQNPEHQYNDNGEYTIELTITDDDNGKNIKTTVLKVLNVKPIASFKYITKNATINVSENIDFKYEATDLDGEIISWKWDLGDGTNSTEKNPSHSYSKPGSYKVKLTVTDDDGETTIGEQTVKVSEWIRPFDLLGGFSLIYLGFIIFIIIMIVVVLILSRRFK